MATSLEEKKTNFTKRGKSKGETTPRLQKKKHVKKLKLEKFEQV